MVDIRPTRVIELVEEGRFDPIIIELSEAVLERLQYIERKAERAKKLRERREKRAAQTKKATKKRKVTR